ncbi:MAG: tetratricopeptide repeat protein [Bacteroidota bacterium]
MRKLYIAFLLLANCLLASAQNNYIDSLKNWIKTHPQSQFDSLKIVNYHRLSYRLAEIEPVEAWKYAYEVDKLALKAKVKVGHSMSKINFAILEKMDGNYEKSQEYYLSAMQIAEKVGWTRGVAICLNNIGEGYKELAQFDKCIEYTNKAVELNESLDQKRGIANNFEVIGDAYYLSGKHGLALDYFKKGFELAKFADDNYQITGRLLTDIGKVYSALKSYHLSNKYFEEAAKLNLKNKEKLQLITTFIEHGKSYRSQGELVKAVELFKKGLIPANELNYSKLRSELYRELSTTNHMLGDLEMALEDFHIHKAIDDQIAKKKIATRNEVIRLRLESYFKEKENIKLKQIKEDQESEIQSKASWIGLLVAALVLGIFGSVYWFYQSRIQNLNKIQIAQAETIRQMKMSEQIRKQLARDLHDDMGSTLSSISILSQVAEKEMNTKDLQAKNLLNKINRNSQRMLDTMNDIVWTTQPVNDTLDSISIKIREFAAEMFDAKDINYTIDIDESLLEYKLPANQVYNFYLIVKEAINNIAKYAKAKNVTVGISMVKNWLQLIIKDDGVGFAYNKIKDKGNGLKNMERRSQDLSGKLTFFSKTNEGTTLILEFPLES